jgi:hypothetical protein
MPTAYPKSKAEAAQMAEAARLRASPAGQKTLENRALRAGVIRKNGDDSLDVALAGFILD